MPRLIFRALFPARILILVACIQSAILVGCATPAPAPTDGDWVSHRERIAALPNWSFSGKIAVKSPRGADTARLRWTQEGENLELDLSGPIGMKQVRIVREDAQLKLWRNGHWESVDEVEPNLVEQLGWSLPLEYLPWWLRGLPAPQLEATEIELSAGRLHKLRQAGWLVEFPVYRQVDAHVLPRTILFRRDDIEGKILLKQWTLGP